MSAAIGNTAVGIKQQNNSSHGEEDTCWRETHKMKVLNNTYLICGLNVISDPLPYPAKLV